MTTPEASAQAPPGAAVNGTSPGPAGPDCETCVTSGEKALAVTGILIGGAIILIAIDLWQGGKLSARAGLGPRAGGDGGDDGGS